VEATRNEYGILVVKFLKSGHVDFW